MAELQVAEVELREVRQAADKATSDCNKLEMKRETLEQNRRHLEDAILEKHRVELVKELHDFHLRAPITPADESRLKELRDLIDRMGEINLTAIEEYEELAGRHDFLGSQKQDLEDALQQLETAITKINKTSRKLFRETFEAVNAKFQEVFPRLFRGGNATLRLTGSDEDLLDAGVEIFAQPPGKKNSTVEQLSGGEKALTAVAMIFSIFLIKPSPFCILDEVDAPLDEANVGRYNELVRSMTEWSQFIVITHNKRTMEIADSLYGVTMEEPGCSKLVNVNLKGFQPKVKRAA
jgi:chromosome segregation protein